MPTLSWNEIRSRAVAFSKEWVGESRERAEAQTFWNEFFEVFGLRRRQVASFEDPVKSIKGTYGFIDLFWRGQLLAEHKSLGQDLGKANSQAMNYIQDLVREGRGEEVPRYVVISDFSRFALHDLDHDTTVEIPLGELQKNVNLFAFIPGYEQHSFKPEDPINIKAVQIMGDLHDSLEAGGYKEHALERMLVRILFCLFAEDTGIFERNAFSLFLENHTREDGSNLGSELAWFFQTLNTPKEDRQANLLEELAELPYVNGELFAESLQFAAFNREMRNRLLACSRFDWSRISPAVFGALFQSVIEPKERRQIGAHYTSERDILKVIGPLFLDELKDELKKAGNDKRKLRKLHDRIAEMKLLDPACGCGNFLVVSYRELRLIELEILERQVRKEKGKTQKVSNVEALLKLDVSQMYGIEIEEWPVRIAEAAMWLMDHQMNQLVSEKFGEYFVRLPLKSSPHIHHGNALRLNWNDVLPASECTHVMGNPPFVGYSNQSKEQKADLRRVANGRKSGGILDFVCAWYIVAHKYVGQSNIQSAFVSTNSITQGQQPSVLWGPMLGEDNYEIQFAHRTFEWQSEARGKASVHVVIIGFGPQKAKAKWIFDYETLRSEPTAVKALNINPYLVDADNVLLSNRSKPICDVPRVRSGCKPVDGGHYLFTPEAKRRFCGLEPKAERYFRRWIGSKEFINGIERWCMWLGEASPANLQAMPRVMEKIEEVVEFRLASTKKKTQELAETPRRFEVETFSISNYLVIPAASSERRNFIPIAFVEPSWIPSNLVNVVLDATLWHFGVLTSTMHMAWMRQVAGRIKSDYRYSANLVYNNFPWPQHVTDAKRKAVEKAAQDVLDVRKLYPDSTLADLYDPLSMPADLTKAHNKLDRAVDKCYRSQPFANERNRVEFLFKLYQELTAPLLPEKKKANKRKKKTG